MRSDELIFLGKIIKSQGFDGALMVALEGNHSEDIEDLESVFVEVDGIPVPFFIASSSLSGRLFSVRFDDYESKDKVIEFIGCKLFADSAFAGKISSPPAPIHITGYRLFSRDMELIGLISRILSYPMQLMLQVEGESGVEILVPFHNDWLIKIDKKSSIVVMDLPEGILSVNE